MEIVETLAAEFEESHPGVTVEHRGWTTDELTTTLPRAVQSGEGPDIAQVNNGESLTGPMVRAGQLVPLDDYDAQYGWSEKMPPGMIARNRYTDDGKTFGQGTLWGVSTTGEIVGFYYNKKIFADNEIEVPQTLADLEAAMQKLKDAGVTPLVFGNLDQWPAIHVYSEILGTMTTREYLDNLIYRTGDETWESDAITQAATKLQEWIDKGYVIDGYEGLSSDDAWPLFAAGEGAMLIQGSWLAGDIANQLGEDAGFFLVPPAEAGGQAISTGGVGIPYSIMKTSENPDLAAEFIDFLVSDRAVELMLEKGVLPGIAVPESAIEPDTLSGDLYTAWNTAVDNDLIGHYLDWATPTFYDTVTAQLQLLMGGQATPEEFAAALQEDYATFLESQT
jgi:raffinose/stachyose/melibiose transport system substrate-binding protein